MVYIADGPGYTNAIRQRSFSAMRRLKTYLRSTMGQKRLNAIMLLHVHKEMTDKLSVVELANTFTNTEHSLFLVPLHKRTCKS